MRIGASILFFNGYCYQSYGWDMFRPLGNLQTAIDILDEYEVDEISIVRPVRSNDKFEIFKNDINLIKSLKTITPVSFGGGINLSAKLNLFSGVPIERLCLSSSFVEINRSLVEDATNLFGRQAIVSYLPIRIHKDKAQVFHCASDKFVDLTHDIIEFCSLYSDEVVIYDVEHDGDNDKFDFELLSFIDLPPSKLIISGGVGKESIQKAYELGISCSLIENRVLHRENSVEYYR